MLEKYQDKYKDFMHYIDQTVIKNKVISHAYLFVAPNNEETKELVIDFAKVILCPNNSNEEEKCDICNLIDINNYSELMIIEPDGLIIKKEQLKNLQENFMSKPLENSHRVYIIFGADKLNDSSGNSILKFLEEPMEGIVAILVCENYLNVLKTIVSRCQVINLMGKQEKEQINFSDEKNARTLDFLNRLEEVHEETIAFTNELLGNISDRELLGNYIDSMIEIYQYVLDYKLGKVNSNYEELKLIIENNDIDSVVKKTKILCDIKADIKYNVNINLLMDKLIIEMSKC